MTCLLLVILGDKQLIKITVELTQNVINEVEVNFGRCPSVLKGNVMPASIGKYFPSSE